MFESKITLYLCSHLDHIVNPEIFNEDAYEVSKARVSRKNVMNFTNTEGHDT